MTKRNRISTSEMMRNFEQVCRAKGLRITHQRSVIFSELVKFPGHPTVENVFRRVRKHLTTISLDTVYRTIATFEEHGLIKKVLVLDNAARFEANPAVHHHLICTRCHKIEDFYWPAFDKLKLPDSIRGWSKTGSRHVEIFGLCRACRARLAKQEQRVGKI